MTDDFPGRTIGCTLSGRTPAMPFAFPTVTPPPDRLDPVFIESWYAEMAKTVAVDFDATIHPYTHGWVGSAPADEEPIAGALEFVEGLKRAGYRVVIFSKRCDHPEGLEGTRVWLEAHGFGPLIDEVTCQKPAAVAYVDDRAVPFRGDWDEVAAAIDALASGRPHGAPPVMP